MSRVDNPPGRGTDHTMFSTFANAAAATAPMHRNGRADVCANAVVIPATKRERIGQPDPGAGGHGNQ